jgi:hypothetical protein
MMRARPSSLPRSALPSVILFEERDGIYWLRGADLERAKKLLNLRVEGVAAGFDAITWSVYLHDLARQKVALGIRDGNTVRRVQLLPTSNVPPPSSPIDLLPCQLFSLTELERLERGLSRKAGTRSTFAWVTEELANGCPEVLAGFGDLYVYELSPNLYELDSELTSVPIAMVGLVAFAAHQAGHCLPCRLVPPKTQRRNGHGGPRLSVQATEVTAYGQLSLPL